MLRYRTGYQPARFAPRIRQVTGAPLRQALVSVGDVADCFVEISADNKRPNFALQDSCQNRAELPRKIESCDQSKNVTQQYEKKDNDSFLSHNFGFLILSGARVKHKVKCNAAYARAVFSGNSNPTLPSYKFTYAANRRPRLKQPLKKIRLSCGEKFFRLLFWNVAAENRFA